MAPPFRFEPEAKVGTGATSEVWRARDRETGRLVALKVGTIEEARRIFADEAERLARAASTSLPELVDVGLVPSVATAPRDAGAWARAPYLALEWIEAAALDVLADRSDEDRRALALAVARDVGEALAALHGAAVAHGDVKPANVLVARERGRGWRARLVDLGLAGDADARAPSGGTARYLPPETWTAGDAGDGRARDRLALGIVLAEIVEASVARATNPVDAARAAKLPAPFDAIVAALLAAEPGARPRAGWVVERARKETREVEPEATRIERARSAVRAAYLASRRAEIARAAAAERADVRARGPAGEWLAQAIAVGARCAELRGDRPAPGAIAIGDGDELARARWLVSLVGAAAASWPAAAFAERDDATWSSALLRVVETREPAALRLGDVERALAGGAVERSRRLEAPEDPVERAARLALALAMSPPDPSAIERVELDPSSPELVRAAADALRRSGEHGRALALLARDDGPAGLALRAEVARRAGDRRLAEALAQAAIASAPDDDAAAAVIARVRLDGGNAMTAEEALARAPRTARTAEVRALVALAKGDRAAASREAEVGEALATTDETRGRLSGLVGYVAHASGDAARAASAFARAADHAARAGALVEEATYRTGEAAAAVDRGAIGEALAASRRAALLWEHLARPADAARALLARAAAFATCGARLEAVAAGLEARERALAAGDARAAAFSWWSMTDASPAGDAEAAFAARAAFGALAEERALDEDGLRAAARLLRHAPADTNRSLLASADALAATEKPQAAARLEWWGARAEAHLAGAALDRADAIVREIVRLVERPAPVASRGPSLAFGAKLARSIGDGDAVRVLIRAQAETARMLLAHAPGDLRESVAALEWVSEARAVEAPAVSVEQVADVEAIVRALGTRDRLRPLLEQVLDSLVLWTGVERGLLLLAAPGGKLVPRVARNLARDDLVGEQRALSQSLARRAVELGEPVVAVDASGELASVHASVHALKLRSVLAVPLVARGETLGVAYLDDRMRRGAFGPSELAWVRLVASLAAVAIADARDQLLLRRAARRAERARSALARELATREAELDAAEKELARARSSRETRFRYDAIVGRSEPIRAMLSLVDRVTPTAVPVLLIGESGSGKELVARAIHANGPRAKRTFVGENCGAIPETLLESTLFGHVRGAFTGADRPRAGLFEVADGGTLFLDEIGEMPLAMQTKLLRVLETGEVRPLGTERGRKVDVRIVAATHRDLKQMVTDGKFREDLFYRLDVITIRVPSLRDRPDDVPLLVQHFLDKHARGQRVRVAKAAMALLSAHAWPGNVRQLENEIRRALVLSDGTIEPEHLSREVRQEATGKRKQELGLHVRARVDALETELIREALGRTRGNQTRAAELLGLSRFGLQKMIKRLAIEI